MNTQFKRILALILAMITVISIPVSSMAEEIMVEDEIGFMSLFPIDEVNAYIDLAECPLEKLPQMTVRELFSHLRNCRTNELIAIDSTSTSVWANFVNDEGSFMYDTWKVLDFDDYVNILDFNISGNYEVEIIIGSGNQLDPENVRYFVDFRLPNESAYMDLRGYIYDELYSFDVSDIVKNIPHLNINNIQSVELLWYVEDLIDSGYKFEGDITNGWLKLAYGDSVKFAPTLEEIYTCGWWNNSLRMIVKFDDTVTMYTLNVDHPEYIDMFDFSIYAQSSYGKRREIAIDEVIGYETRRRVDGEYIYYYDMCAQVKSNNSPKDVYYFGINLSEDFEHCDLKVIKGWEYNQDQIRSWIIDEKIPEQIDITKEFVAEDMSLTDAGLKDYWLQNNGLEVMLCVISDNNDIYIIPATLGMYHNYNYVDVEGIYADVDGARERIFNYSSYDYEEEEINDVWYYTEIITYYLNKGYNVDAEYSVGMLFYDGDLHDVDATKVDKAVVGRYYSRDEAKNEPDIKKYLFEEDIYSVGSGYKANFSGEGVDFTIFSGEDIWNIRIKVEENNYEEEPESGDVPEIGSADSYFKVLDLYSGNDCLDTYIVPYKYDTYYNYGYQTVLINNTEVDMTSVSPEVNLATNAKVYYGDTMEHTNNNYSNKLSPRDFNQIPADETKDPYNAVRYTVSAQNHANQKNYWVTAVKKEEGAKLFVNGPAEREIFLNNYFGNVHDIFVANVGTEELTGITATIDATNIKLDEYWTLGGDGNDTLAPFTITSNDTGNYYGELFNVARIRLVPDGEGEITGTLTITADGQDPVVINLTGTAGNPKIDTTTVHDAVKYVPYSSIITTNNMHDWNKVTFSISEGRLPDGLTLYPNGEIYGVPKETGEFPVTIKAKYSYAEFEASYAELVLTVKDNSDDNINASVDNGYEITTRLPATISSYSDIDFVIDGEFSEFVDLWLDGEKLVENDDYTAREGSTKITIKSKTFNKMKKGKHTIAAEFRVGGDMNNELKTASQNFSIVDTTPVSSGGGGGGVTTYTVTFETNGGSAVAKQTVKYGSKFSELPTPVKEGYVFAGWFKDKDLTKPFDLSEKITSKVNLYAKWDADVPDTPTVNADDFVDVAIDDWFYEDVQWVYENKLMVGYNDEQFAPSEAITSSMVITVLARLADVDITAYETKHHEDVTDGQWYTSYAIWAKENGIAEDISFVSPAEITREMMGVVLVRFFKYMGKEFVVSEEFVEFADADLISDKAMESIQTLYKLEIFRGKGDNIIDPLGNTTRAEFAALMHRVYNLMNK